MWSTEFYTKWKRIFRPFRSSKSPAFQLVHGGDIFQALPLGFIEALQEPEFRAWIQDSQFVKAASRLRDEGADFPDGIRLQQVRRDLQSTNGRHQEPLKDIVVDMC
ncbi:hypothetical protein HMN09_00974100 [Mycena chlorophos]|uniref:Uncharacterized protein n=1 Tax=Mycena chlorophos TaxID=658473 RepID=A0A8H6W1M9_MYCCL|nr:hypothetical protein HMN09_00974100 [Mycena chlorophos]